MSRSWTPRAVIVGSGLAGLSCARDLAALGWRIDVVSAGRPGRDGASHRVHALAPWILLTAPWVRGDSPARFLADLKRRGQGLERDGLTEVFAEQAHTAGAELCELLGLTPLDAKPVVLPGDELPRGRRCLPRERRPLLVPLLQECAAAGVRVVERTVVVGILTGQRRAVGVAAWERDARRLARLEADVVVLACGGLGAVFPLTTVPRWCRGSGLALAGAAGVLLHRPHLTQALPVTATPPLYFPTTVALLAGHIVIGGRSLEAAGDLAAAAEVIARALRQGAQVFLDPSHNGATALLPAKVRESATFRREGRVPLTLAVHHGIGGVAIDAWGRTSLPGLYACGEAAGGVQGARRTMGTGLLEARIFGRRAARAAAHDATKLGPAGAPEVCRLPPCPPDPEALERRLDELMGPLAVLRPDDEVAAALAELSGWAVQAGDDGNERGFLAGIRRAAALEVLRAGAAQPSGGRGDGPGQSRQEAERPEEEGWPKTS